MDSENQSKESTAGDVSSDSKKPSWISSHQQHIYGWGAFILGALAINWSGFFADSGFDPELLDYLLFGIRISQFEPGLEQYPVELVLVDGFLHDSE